MGEQRQENLSDLAKMATGKFQTQNYTQNLSNSHRSSTKLVKNTFKNMSQRYFYLYLISHVLGEPSMITESEY